MKYWLPFLFQFVFIGSFAQNKLDGNWHSSFIVMGQPMLLDLEINAAAGEAALTAPDQSMYKMICSEVILEEEIVHFAWKQGNLVFQGSYFTNGDSIAGTMKQNGLEWNLAFHREIQEKKEVSRPQTPHGPFDYVVEDISFPNKQDQTTLYATLTLPKKGNGNYPIVVLASGSGPQDRNCTILGHQSFWVIADYLAKNGIGTLRFDDRGTGQSKANYSQASLQDFGSDVASCVRYLKTRKDLKKHPVGLIGHSEGGMHILLAQKELKKKVDFLIFLASIGGTGEATLVKQQYDIPIKNGSSEEAAQWNTMLYEGMAKIVMNYEDGPVCNDSLNSFLHHMYVNAPQGAIDGQSESNFVWSTSRFLNNSWGRQFLQFNAGDYLSQLEKLPLLALFGENDIQVDAVSNLEAFNQALSPQEKAYATLEIIPGINHLMQTCTKCTVMEYGELTETINPVILERLKAFILHL